MDELEKLLEVGDKIVLTRYNTGNVGLILNGNEYISKSIKGCLENIEECKNLFNKN